MPEQTTKRRGQTRLVKMTDRSLTRNPHCIHLTHFNQTRRRFCKKCQRSNPPVYKIGRIGQWMETNEL